jgi:hypothetical protein
MAVDGAHGHVFVSGGEGTHEVGVYDFDGNLVRFLKGFNGPQGLAVDGSNLYVSNVGGATIDRLSTATLEKAETYEIDMPYPRDLVVLKGRVWFVAGKCSAHDQAIAYLDPDTGKVGIGNDELINMMPCGRLVATSSVDDTFFSWMSGAEPGSINRWHVVDPVIDGVTEPSLELVSKKRIEEYSGIHDVGVSPSGDRIVPMNTFANFSEYDWDFNPTTPHHGFGLGRAAAFSPDGTRIAAAFTPRSARLTQINLYSAGTEGALGHISLSRAIVENGLTFSPDGSRLFAVVAAGRDEYDFPSAPYVLEAMSSTRFDAVLKLTASRQEVKYGNKITLTARMNEDLHAKEVRFYGLRKGRELFVGKAPVDDAGVARLSGAPTRNTTFIARWVGDETYKPSRSNKVKVEVAVRIFTKLFGTYGSRGHYKLIHQGADAVWAAQLAPPHDHGKLHVYLEYETYYGWKGARVVAKVTKRGAGVGLKNLPVGTYRISAGFSDRDHKTGFSRITDFKITR